MIDNPIILALDYSDLQEAHSMLDLVRPHIGMIKIGLELFTAYGKEALELSKIFNIPVFLDLKLHDVPTTVAKTIGVICSRLAPFHGKHFLSIHCSGGKEMCKAAVQACEGSNVTIAGVTLLTSIEHRDLVGLGFSNTQAIDHTRRPAWIAEAAGVTHFICAPNQAKLMRRDFANSILITPGIRGNFDINHDHQRVKTATASLKDGANWLVIGRPITQSPDPLAAAEKLKLQIEKI